MKTAATVILAALVLFTTATVWAAFGEPTPIPDPEINLGSWISTLVDAFASSSWKLVGAIGIVGAVAAVRKWSPYSSGKAAVAISLALGALAGLAITLANGEPATLESVINGIAGGLVTALAGSGLYAQAKKLKEV